jgi:phosphate:Na+ symporter
LRIFQKVFLPSIIIMLLVGFWYSPDFKTIAAGVSIFLFGMYFLEQGFNAFTGGMLERLLAKTTDKLWKSIGFGVVSTTIMQSSSLVSVISISFISAGLIGLSAGIGIVFGANLGTTTGAWMVAAFGLKVKISAYAMPMLVVGLILTFQKSNHMRGFGYILTGLGFLFLGIHFMKEGFEAFKDQINLAEFAIPGLKGLLIYTLIGMAATVVMQSSHATMVLIITALSLGHVTYENAIALAIGANIGTTITAIIGSLSSNYQGKQLAGAHLIFNFVTGAIAIIGINVIITAVDYISAAVGIGAENYTLKLAVFHTVFNLIGVIVMTPFVGRLVIFLEKTITPRNKEATEPYFLNDAVLDFPDTLLQAVRNEIIHLYNNTALLFINGLHMETSMLEEGKDLQREIHADQKIVEYDFDERYRAKVKPLFAAIIEFISKGQGAIPAEQQAQLFELRLACLKLSESIKAVDGLRSNMTIYFKSDNEIIRNEYNQMRIHIASVLKEMSQLEHEKDHDTEIMLSLDEFRVQIKKYRKETNIRLDKLIRNGEIDSFTATSILNDRTFTRDAVKGLLDVGKILFSTRDIELKNVEEMISLSDKEIDAVASAGN